MGEIFLKALNMSITANWMVLAVIAVTLIFKRIPKWINCLLWGLAGLRLILPFSFESIFSLAPSADALDESILISQTPSIDSGIPIINQTVNPALSQGFAPDNTASSAPMQIFMFILSVVWLAGIAAMLIYGAVSYIKIKRKTSESINLKDNIYYCDNIDTPFILGIIKPKIYIPSGMDESYIDYIISHESAHLKRKDHIWKPLGFLILSFYWFNPVLWAAYILLCRDIEKACDEKVIKNMDAEDKKCYSEAIVASSTHRRMIMARPLAFGEVGVKARIKNMSSYKKPTLWIIIAAVILSVILSVCFLTNPKTTKLQNIEQLSLENIFESPAAVIISSDGQTYKPVNSDGGLYGLGKIKISKRAVSENRSEERKISRAVALQSEEDAKPSVNSYIKGTVICFNEDMTEVWVENGVKPTLTYKVLESKKAREIFKKLQKDIKPHEDKANTEVDAAQFESTLSYVGWTGARRLYFAALNSNKLTLSSVKHLPVYKFDTLNDLEQFRRSFSGILKMDCGADEIPSFNSSVSKYNSNFFKENSLILVYIAVNNSTHRFKPQSVNCNGDSICINIEETTKAETVDWAMSGWFVTVSVPKKTIEKCTEFDAVLRNSENSSDKTNTSDGSSEHETGSEESGRSTDISRQKPDSVKVNSGIIVEIKDGLIIVERDKDEGNYIHTNDDKFSNSKRFAFKTDKADKFKIGDRVTIAHNGDFKNSDPPAGVALGVSKADAPSTTA